MSINIENPQTTLEKADATANFIEQMFLAHKMHDEKRFNEAHQKASSLLSDVVEELDK